MSELGMFITTGGRSVYLSPLPHMQIQYNYFALLQKRKDQIWAEPGSFTVKLGLRTNL